MNTKKHEVIAAELIAGKQGGIRLLELLGSKASGQYTFYHEGGAALLSVMNKGRTCSLLPSVPKDGDEGDALQSLLKQAIESLSTQSLSLAQIVLANPAPTLQVRALIEAGFEDLATLHYLERLSSITVFRTSTFAGLQFQSMETIGDDTLGKVLEETYIESLDCPKLHGVRSTRDIIDGHRMSSTYHPEYWFIGTIDGASACVLLLNPNDDALELAYVGVIPSQRERGIADSCVAKAIEIAQLDDFKRITLVVDSANANACNLYDKWNFEIRQSRQAFMYKLC
ncbi:MAG: GNAT family N-acetyltransferase [Phycisphaerales bacterium]|nr:GNAT family N-acetyltransferase [Phycisphaerales bacterium]